MNDCISVEFYSDNNPSGARTIWLEIVDGKLYMAEQDVSPQLKQIFGRDTFERFISKISVDEVKRVLQVDPNA